MIVVIFEIKVKQGMESEYLRLAEDVNPENIDGFVSIERFVSVSEEGRLMSLSYWECEEAVSEWIKSKELDLIYLMDKNSLLDECLIKIAEII